MGAEAAEARDRNPVAPGGRRSQRIDRNYGDIIAILFRVPPMAPNGRRRSDRAACRARALAQRGASGSPDGAAPGR
jgi:hypothetical protein